jgi:hypothetical protein
MAVVVALLLVTTAAAPAAVALLKDDIEFMWGPDHSFFSDDGNTLALCLEKTHGSGFRSKGAYLYARYDIDVKLVANNSAGTVTTVYVSCPPDPAAAMPSLIRFPVEAVTTPRHAVTTPADDVRSPFLLTCLAIVAADDG